MFSKLMILALILSFYFLKDAWFCGRCSVLIDDFLKKDGLLHSKGDKSL